MKLDDTDLEILKLLVGQGRMTWAELAGRLGLSAPATADRVRRLEDSGLIQGYSAILDAPQLGYGLTAFIAVTLDRPEHRAGFLACVQAQPEIQECHHVTGDDDYLMKVRCRGTADLEHLISEVLKQIPGVLKTRTLIALSTPKETTALPLAGDSED